MIVPVPFGCDDACSPAYPAATTPGPQGEAGEDGADGTSGVSAFTFVANDSPADQPEMPAEGASVTVNTTSSTAFLQPNQYVFVAFWGTMKVFSVPTSSSLVLQNAMNTAGGLYLDNAAAGTPLPAGSRITITGEQGESGSTPGGALLAVNNLSDVSNPTLARTELGLGTAAEATVGIADGNLPPSDGGLTPGDFVQATATGLTTIDTATAQSNLGLGTMATQDANSVAITGGAIEGTTVGASTPDSVAATTLSASGTATLSGDVIHGAKTFTPSSAIQTLAAGNPVNPNASKVRVAGSGGAVTITATPSITNPASDGQRLLIMGTSDANTITLQDKSILGGSNLNLAGDANVTLGEGDTIDLIWDAVLAGWYEIGRSLN